MVGVVSYLGGFSQILFLPDAHKLITLKVSSNVWSNSSQESFHMTFVVCVSAAETLGP